MNHNLHAPLLKVNYMPVDLFVPRSQTKRRREEEEEESQLSSHNKRRNMTTKKEKVLKELFTALQELKYPEVAQTHLNDFENTILTGSKRVDLLHWLLLENPICSSAFLIKMKESTLEAKLLKCYSEMGLCNDEDIFLGKCPIEKQLHFLSLLTLFIRNVHLVDKQSSVDEEEAMNKSIEALFQDDDPDETTKPTDDDIKIEEGSAESLESSKKSLDDLCKKAQQDVEELNKQDPEIYNEKLEKFKSSFEKVTSMQTQSGNSSTFSEFYKDFSKDVGNIHELFGIVNKTFVNEEKMKNQQRPESLTNSMKPLTEAIKNNNVSVEQACNTFARN